MDERFLAQLAEMRSLGRKTYQDRIPRRVGKWEGPYPGGPGSPMYVRVTAYDDATQVYSGLEQKHSTAHPYEFEDTATNIQFFDWESTLVVPNTETQFIPIDKIVPVWFTRIGNMTIGHEPRVFPVRCFDSGGTAGSGYGDGVTESTVFDVYHIFDTAKTIPLKINSAPIKPRFPGCEYVRPAGEEENGMIGTAYWDFVGGVMELVLIEVVEERPAFAIRVDASTNRLILEGGQLTATGNRYVELGESKDTPCDSPGS